MRSKAAVALFLLVLSGCAGLGGLGPSVPVGADREAVVRTAYRLLGTPYRFGGATPDGFDCSGYVAYVYSEAVGLSLPHYTGAQIQEGRPLAPAELLPADLVFFRIGGRTPLHVGIYLGQNQFIHAPSRDGEVSVERLDHPYWKQRYKTARRLLPPFPAKKGPMRRAALSSGRRADQP